MVTPQRNHRAFTLIELLVVIAIIAILAAILFPVFGVVREQARQSNTMSSLHSVYVGAKMFNDDEGHFPYTLFPYAETTVTPAAIPTNRPVIGCTPAGSNCSPATSDGNIIPYNHSTGNYITTIANQPERGFLFPEQLKDAIVYANSDNVGRKSTDVTIAYWPLNSPVSVALGGTAANPIPVTWQVPGNAGACPAGGDRDIPSANGFNYVGTAKVYYFIDSMDIGPMLNTDGTIIYYPGTNQPRYELHYSPDWTHLFGLTCDVNGSGVPYVTQLKYTNPPSDKTVITYVTQHIPTAGSSKVMVLTLDGNVRKVDSVKAGAELPLNYVP